MMKRIIRYLDYAIYWLIVLIPFSITVAPAPLNVFIGFLIAAFLVKKILKREPLFTKTPINIPLLIFFIVSCISVFNSIDLRDSFKGGIGRLLQYIVIFFAVVEGLRDKKHINKIIISILAGIILTCADEIWQVAAGYDFIRGYKPVINIGLVRATASFKDSNTLGIYLSALAPSVFGLTLQLPEEPHRRAGLNLPYGLIGVLYYFKGVKKIIFIFISAAALIGIILTYSRPTLLAAYIALFFLAIAKKKKVLIACLVVLTLVSPFILPKSVKDWAREVDYNPLRFMCNDDRIAVYRHSINMIKAHPLIGVGTNAYMKSYKKYKEFPEYRNVVTLDEMKAHNNFLQMAAEVGLLGFGAFIWLLYVLFRQCAKIYKRLNDGFLKIVSLALAACVIAFLVNGLTESSLYYSRVAAIFWYLTGFSLALNKFIDENRAEKY